jgi:hypothetical protein
MTSLKQYVALKTNENLLATYRDANRLETLRKKTTELLAPLNVSAALLDPKAFTVGSAPSLDWTLKVVGDVPPGQPSPTELIISYDFQDQKLLEEFRDTILHNLNKPIGPYGDVFLGVGADPSGGPADHWCPGAGVLATFGNRAAAREVLDADALTAALGPLRKVNVVIIDQGLNKEAIEAKHPNSWGGGWGLGSVAPGTAESTSHGMLIARNVLDIAPEAIVYDMPLIPKTVIANIPAFASLADSAFHFLLLSIAFLRLFPRWSGPWVLVNAWAIYDRASEIPRGDYTENLHPLGHRLNAIVAAAAQQYSIDAVFAAGNCGTFCPSPQCGQLDRGPGHSIWGANSSAAVVTVGAVLTNEMWLGYSSQGPGQVRLGLQKPDFCAPSQFREVTDTRTHNTGTSTACALTAGVIAQLRTRWNANQLPPQALKDVLIETTRKTQGFAWNGRLGNGILNAGEAYRKLSQPAAPAVPPQASTGQVPPGVS